MRKVLALIMATILGMACGCASENTVQPQAPANGITLQLNTDSEALKSAVTAYASRHGFAVGAAGIPLNFTVNGTDGEGYTVVCTANAVSITADSEAAAFYAAQDACAELVAAGVSGLGDKTVTDAPVFPLRGVIEGFYGTPWTHEYRVSLMDFLGDMKMNAYMYAPKDDQKHLKLWREAYTDAEKAELKELVDAAKRNYVDFIYALSPGNDIDFGAGYEQEFATLTAKMQSLYDLGVRHFAVLFDDIETKNAEGQTRLLNEFQEKFIKTHEGAADLITVPTEYADILCNSTYAVNFGKWLSKDIEIMWTGNMIVPDSVTNENLRLSQTLFGRKVIIWWNYPCNDFATNKLFMGAAENLGPDLDQSTTGFLTNPMNQGEASKVPMYTLAKYLWDPASYDADTAQSEACLYLANGDETVAKALEFFVEHTCATNINNYAESTFYKKYADALAHNEPIDTAQAVADFQKLLAMSETLQNSGNAQLLKEISPWLTKLRMFGKLAISYFTMIEMETAGADAAEIEAKKTECLNFIRALDASDRVAGSTTLLPIKAQIELLLKHVGTGTLLPSTIDSDISRYAEYHIELATDNDTKTFFWCRDPVEGSHITLDFGAERHVTSIRLLMGAEGHEKDFIKEGSLQYSSDGETWTELADTDTATVALGDLDIDCRFVRLVCKKAQVEWVTVMEFNAYS